MVQPGHVSLWHPWTDKPGANHRLSLWSEVKEQNFDSVSNLARYFADNQLYTFCNDIFDAEEVADSTALVQYAGHKNTFISRTGKVVALRLSRRRKSGYFIPATVWKWPTEPGKELLSNVGHIFRTFKYEALSPASLSEKVLRSTLPERMFISRPSAMVRRVLIENGVGGRIDEAKIARFYPIIYEYDLNKAYMYFSRNVPSPFLSPVRFYYGEKGIQDARWMDCSSSFMHVRLVAHARKIYVGVGDTGYFHSIHPLQITDEGGTREPVEGEIIDRWLWNSELEDCLKAGYTLLHVHSGYGWRENSNFMVQWSEILYDNLKYIENDHQKAIWKTMAVGLPGRFLKKPESYTLVHKSEARKGDEPILVNWTAKTKKYLADWYIRVEYDLQSAQLTPIGSNILAQCRSALYRQQLRELQGGNSIIMAYIDSIRLGVPTASPAIIGSDIGQWKEKRIERAWAVGNQIIPENELEMKAPGISGKYRKQLYKAYHGREYHV
jgi:hypothetical protein